MGHCQPASLVFFNKTGRMEFLQTCAGGNYEAVISFLPTDPLDRSTKVNYQHPINGWTGLMWAVKRDHVKVAQLLLQSGANPAAVNAKGETAALFCASDAMHSVLADRYGADAVLVKKTESDFVPNYLVDPSSIPPLDQIMTKIDAEMKGRQGGTTSWQAQGLVKEEPGAINAAATAPIPVPHSAHPSSTPRSTELLADTQDAYRDIAEYQEILVHLENPTLVILGAVHIRTPQDSIHNLIDLVKGSLDGVPASFAIARVDLKGNVIPVATKQYRQPAGLHFMHGHSLLLKMV
ncbi:hypothetical protein BC830DRAFT_875571 [Chytriomyces sp. MP71]|nr:hypothetical protein BC830DRAFT_875571 [Chytriomyces sp. MP71]